MQSDDTPPASPAATDEAPCRHEWYLGKCAHCERTVSEVRASPAATDTMSTMEERAREIMKPIFECRMFDDEEMCAAILAALREAKAEGAREMQERCAEVAEAFPSLTKACEEIADAIRAMEPAP